MMKTGMVLEGGAMRGLFTAGVLDVMLTAGLSVDAIVGVSAGAAFGCNYKSRQIGRVLRYNKKYCKDPRFCSFRSLIKTGDLYGADFCYRELPETLDPFDNDAFAADPTEFYVVCTETISGAPTYRKLERSDREGLEWMRASASMPLVSTPVKLEGRTYLDGGIADSIPIRFLEERGYGHNIIILTRPDGYRKKPNKLVPLMRLLLRKHPGIVRAMQQRHTVYNETLAYIETLERAGKALVIRPSAPLQIGHIEHDPAVLQRVYDEGVAEGKRRLEEITAFIAARKEKEL